MPPTLLLCFTHLHPDVTITGLSPKCFLIISRISTTFRSSSSNPHPHLHANSDCLK